MKMSTGMPPCNLEAEKEILASIFQNNQRLYDVGFLEPEHFYGESHGKLFARLRELIDAGTPTDLPMLNLCDTLCGGDRNKSAALTGVLLDGGDVAGGIGHLGREVLKCYHARQRIEAYQRAEHKLRNVDGNLAAAMAETDGAVLDTIHENTIRETKSTPEIILDVLQSIEDRRDGERGAGLASGISGLDEHVRFHSDEMYMVGGRPGGGKTSFALDVCLTAVRADVPVLFISLDMSGKAIVERGLSMLSGVPVAAIRGGGLTEHDRDRIVNAATYLQDRPFHVAHGAYKFSEVEGLARQYKRRHGIGLFVLDYIQRIDTSGRNVESRARELSNICNRLKDLNISLEIPVLVLSQFNRETGDGTPRLSNFKDSGGQEESCDVAMGLRLLGGNQAEISVLKNRNGKAGVILEVHFDAARTSFTDHTKDRGA